MRGPADMAANLTSGSHSLGEVRPNAAPGRYDTAIHHECFTENLLLSAWRTSGANISWPGEAFTLRSVPRSIAARRISSN
jgi:hypothetical protein